MRSKTAQKILDETPQEVKEKVIAVADKMVENMKSKNEKKEEFLKGLAGLSTDKAMEVAELLDKEAAQSVAEFKQRLKDVVQRSRRTIVHKSQILTLIDETK